MQDNDRQDTRTSDAARAAGGFAVELIAGIGAALLQFVVLGLLLAVAAALVVFVDPWVGFGVGAIGFIVWSVTTGWTFW